MSSKSLRELTKQVACGYCEAEGLGTCPTFCELYTAAFGAIRAAYYQGLEDAAGEAERLIRDLMELQEGVEK